MSPDQHSPVNLTLAETLDAPPRWAHRQGVARGRARLGAHALAQHALVARGAQAVALKALAELLEHLLHLRLLLLPGGAGRACTPQGL